MRLQISTRLAIFAALELSAREGSQLSVADIGEKYGVSSHHLAKVMHVMGRAGLVRSVRGAGGGYQFAGNARRTTLLDMTQLFEELSSVEPDGGATDATPEDSALRASAQRDRRHRARDARIDHHRHHAQAGGAPGQWPRAGEAQVRAGRRRPDFPSIIYLRTCTRDAAKSAA